MSKSTFNNTINNNTVDSNILTFNLTPQEETNYYDIFQLYDTEHNNTITIKQLKDIINILKLNIDNNSLQHICEQQYSIVYDNDTVITYNQYINILNYNIKSLHSRAQVKHAFRQFIPDRSINDIDINKLKKLLLTYSDQHKNIHINENDIDNLLQQLDVDDNGKFNFALYTDTLTK